METKYTPWIASHTAQKQSNYGKYKAGIHRGEGMAFQSVNIMADTPELALEIARHAAAAPDLLEALRELSRFRDAGKQPPIRVWQQAADAIAKTGAA